jgi:site-specific DNA-methyltransferase (adenine-specific)
MIVQGDALHLPLPDSSVDAICTDPPYGLEFMGKEWDKFKGANDWAKVDPANPEGFLGSDGVLRRKTQPFSAHTDRPRFHAGQPFQAWCEQWATEALRVLKPGGWLLAFGGTRTWHRLACGIEDAGFELRDTIAEFGPLAWVYGSGFPKSLDVGKAIDKAAGVQREVVGRWEQPGRGKRSPVQRYGLTNDAGDITAPATPEAERWQGWGTSLKPAWEPVIVARKPLAGSVAQNVLAYGTGALNIDATRIGMTDDDRAATAAHNRHGDWGSKARDNRVYGQDNRARGDDGNWSPPGRWPSNVVLIHDPGCVPVGVRKVRGSNGIRGRGGNVYGGGRGYTTDFGETGQEVGYADPDGTETITAWDCEENCPVFLLDQQSGNRPGAVSNGRTGRSSGYSGSWGPQSQAPSYADQGGASRFYPTFQAESRLFYTPKAPRTERVTIDGEGHPTVKPLDLMRWLVRLVTPPGGLVLDPFGGSGTTGEAAMLEGFNAIILDKDPASCAKAKIRTHPTIRRTTVTTDPDTGELVEDQPRLW